MGYLVYEACEFVYKPCYYVTHACCFVHIWSYSVKRLCYYVKKLWSIHHAIMLNICVVLSKQCHYVKRLCYYVKKSGYLVYGASELVCKCVIMLNAWFVMSTHCLILLKGYAVMLKFGLSCL